VSSITPEFAAIWSRETRKAQKEGKTLPDLFEVVEEYRDYRRQFIVDKSQSTKSAFSTSFQGQPQEKKFSKEDCLCGEPHLFKDCPYLIREKQQAGWKPDPAIQERIKEKMRIPSLKTVIEKARAEQKKMQGQQKKEADKETPKTDKKEIHEEGTFATSISTFSTSYPSGEIYALYDSFILDSASTIHICNNPERFQSL
jgi:hypothetical protein